MITINEQQYQKALKGVFISNSNIVKFPSDLYKYMMIIDSPCGMGKTYYSLTQNDDGLLSAINKKLVSDNLLVCKDVRIKPEETVFLTPRKVIADQQLETNKDYCIEAKPYDYDDSVMDWQKSDSEIAKRKGKIRITTAHQFAEWYKKGIIKKIPKLVILDEAHDGFAEASFADSLIFLNRFFRENWDSVIKVGLTATPEILLRYMADDIIKFKIVSVDTGTKYKVAKISCYVAGRGSTLLEQVKPQISQKHKVLYYTQSARECYKLYKDYGKRSAFLISDYNDSVVDGVLIKDKMNEDKYNGLTVKQYIIKYEKFPEDIDIIFINSACREGMNIKDSAVKTVICEAVDMITIEQVLGRIRGDLERFMVVCNFNNLERVEKNIQELYEFLKLLEATPEDDKRVVMAKRHQKQQDIKNSQIIVYDCGNNQYKLNPYLKPYLQYINECYIQLRNYTDGNRKDCYSTYYISSVGDRELLTCENYLNRLCKYAVDGKITIEGIWKVAVELNHENAVSKFQKIEEEWMNKPLGTAEKNVLAETLNIVRSKGKKAKWNTIKPLLIDGGYTIKQKQIGSKKYDIISK